MSRRVSRIFTVFEMLAAAVCGFAVGYSLSSYAVKNLGFESLLPIWRIAGIALIVWLAAFVVVRLPFETEESVEFQRNIAVLESRVFLASLATGIVLAVALCAIGV